MQDSIVTTTDYLSGFQYLDEVLQFFPTAEGYVEPTETGGYQYVYNYTDHLGNNRLSYTFDTTTSSLQIREENNYYPFGLKQKGYNDESINSGYQYQYNGKEWQDELGLNMYAMDMRQYDPAIARWVVQDPVVHYNLSLYNGFNNNPVFWKDPYGTSSEMPDWIKDLWYASNGDTKWTNNDDGTWLGSNGRIIRPKPYPKSGIGSLNYYIFRQLDFLDRNPGGTPPDYYMEYGNKYIKRFTNETNNKLTKKGKKWLSQARINLQIAIEDELIKRDNYQLEYDNDAFSDFAFDSHVDAYWNAGLYNLETLDLVNILLTPDFDDLISKRGRKQAVEMGIKFAVYWLENPDVFKQRVNEAKRDKKIIQHLFEEKAESEGVPLEELRRILSPVLLLITKN